MHPFYYYLLQFWSIFLTCWTGYHFSYVLYIQFNHHAIQKVTLLSSVASTKVASFTLPAKQSSLPKQSNNQHSAVNALFKYLSNQYYNKEKSFLDLLKCILDDYYLTSAVKKSRRRLTDLSRSNQVSTEVTALIKDLPNTYEKKNRRKLSQEYVR